MIPQATPQIPITPVPHVDHGSVLKVERVTKLFGNLPALSDVSLDVPRGEFIVVLGAAGAGKTTLLRIIAGLEDPDLGHVLIDGEDMDGHEPKDRDVAMIFDNLALYPNKTGFDNIAHPLRVRKRDRQAIEEQVHAVAATLQISHILSRLPKTMSGGERQRVALGRALVRDPRLFLLDEPLSSLDAMLRVELRAELKRLQQEHHYSFLLATPDFTEALAVADTIVMLVRGEVRQVGSPQEIYENPVDRDVARFVGAPEINLIQAQISGAGGRELAMLGHSFASPAGLTKTLGSVRFEAGLRPEHLKLTKPGPSAAAAEITDIEPLGIQSAITLNASGDIIRTTVPAAAAESMQVGETLGVEPALDRLLAFDSDTGKRLA